MRKFGASVLVAATAAATLTPLNVATAAQADCQTSIPVSGDVDGDGSSDLLVGLPGRNNGTGEVDLRLSTAPSKILTQQNAGLGQGASATPSGQLSLWPISTMTAATTSLSVLPEPVAARVESM